MSETHGGLARAAVRASFERAASHYDEHAALQQEVAGRLLERLDLVRAQPARILDIGCGTGFCTRDLAARYPEAEIIGIDIAEAMAHTAARHQGDLSGAFLVADAEHLPLADNTIDFAISSLSLQWCDPIRLFAEMRRVLRPGGYLLFSSFGPDSLHELRAAWAEVDDGVHVHQFIDMHDLGDALMHCGFAEPVMDVDMIRLDYPDVLSMLRDLKGIGAHNAARERSRGLTGKDRFARFDAAYTAHALGDGRIPATYEIVYGQAWVPEHDIARPSGRNTITLDEIGGLVRRGRK